MSVTVALLNHYKKRMQLLWSARLYHIFPHYLINDTIFGNKLLNIKYVFRFYLQLFPKYL